MVKDENGIDVARQCECVEARKAERLFKSSAITEEFRKLRFGNFDVEGKPPEVAEAKTMALKYFKEFDDIRKNRKNSIAMLGQPGSGKTHLLIALCLNLIAKGVSVHYFQWVDGMNDLQSDFNLLNQKIERLQRVEVLYIDDLFKGRDKPTPWQMSQAFAIINYRYLNHLPILVSAERDFEVLMNPEYGDEALGSRLYEMCRDYTMVLDGKHLNHRLR